MKILYPAKKWLFKVAGVLLFAGILFIIHSCKKDFTKQEQTLSDPEIIKVKDWYQQSFPASASSNNAKSDIAVSSTTSGTPSELDQYIDPDWINTNKYKRFNKNVYEIPLNPDNKFAAALKNPNTGKSYGNKANSKTSFLILKDDAGYHAYVMYIIADSAYLKGDLTKLARTAYNKRDTDFSGTVLYFTPKGAYLSGYKYLNGHLLSPSVSTSAGKSVQSIAANNKKVAGVTTNCDDWYWVIRVNGVIVSTTYLYTTCTTLDDGDGSGNGGDGTGIGGPPPVCPPGSTRITPIHVTDDGSPSDGLDSGDGSTGFPPPTTTQPCVVPVTDTTKDPCNERLIVSALAANSIISGKRASIVNQSTTYEYGSVIARTSTTGTPSYVNSPVTTDEYTDMWIGPGFTWNSTAGFQIGSIHDHPDGSPPDPDDLFTLIYNYSNSADLLGASAADQDFYKTNAIIIVPNSNGDYMVTINDWASFAILYAQFQKDRTTFNNNFEQVASDNQSRQFALLSIFGNSINFYRSSPGTNNFEPLTIKTDSNDSKSVATKRCPN